jgi:hypothetical protein
MRQLIATYLERLDSAEVGPERLFASQSAKDRHESLLAYASRKHAAAQYHLSNVRKLLVSDLGRMTKDEQDSSFVAGDIVTESASTFTRTADEYSFELSAFLEALKSAVDLLSEASCIYLKGVNANYSITPLLKLSERSETGPVIDEVKDNSFWLRSLQDYRHHLVHRLMPSTRTGHVIRSVGMLTSAAVIPVVVPVRTPQYAPDTRRALAEQIMTDPLEGLQGILVQTERGITKVDDKAETVHYAVRIYPADGYQLIEQFMEENLEAFQAFTEQLIQAFITLNFTAVAFTRAS